MYVPIKKANIEALNLRHSAGDGLAAVNLFVHHTLTPEREAELIDIVEKAALAAISTFIAS